MRWWLVWGVSFLFWFIGSWGGGGLGGEVDAGGGLRDALLDVVHFESCGGVGSGVLEVRDGRGRATFDLSGSGCGREVVGRIWCQLTQCNQCLAEMRSRVSRRGGPDKAAMASGCFGVGVRSTGKVSVVGVPTLHSAQ